MTITRSLNIKENKRHCIYCNEIIIEEENFKLSTNRSMGFGLIGLSHVECDVRSELMADETL